MLWTYRKKNMAIRKIQANTNFLTEGVKRKNHRPHINCYMGDYFFRKQKKKE